MTEINNIQTNVQPQSPPPKGDYQIDAHYSSDMKVKRPKITPSEGPVSLNPTHIYNDRDATLKMRQINDDIYEGSKNFKPKKRTKNKSNLDKIEQKENSNHGFNSRLYLKIFTALTLAILAIAGIRKIRSRK